MRQQRDPAFAQALNRMKIGVMTKEDILLLKSREVSAFNQPRDNVVWLFHFREKVWAHKKTTKDRCQETEIRATAVNKIEGKEDLDEKGKEKLLREAQQLNYQDAQGLPFELTLKISSVLVPTTGWIKISEGRTGAQAREAYSGPKPNTIDPSWSPIKLEIKPVKYWKGSQVRVVRSQFPLAPAEAITIYKSQSQTFTERALTTHPGKPY